VTLLEAIRFILETMACVRAMISWARFVMDCEVYWGAAAARTRATAALRAGCEESGG
jgi:hypothetical protein